MLQKPGGLDQEERLNQLFRALQHPVRRRLLFSLLDHNPHHPVVVPEDVHDGEQSLDSLNTALVHHHLPMLEEAGFIDRDGDSQEIRMGSNFTAIRNPLSALREQVEADELTVDGRDVTAGRERNDALSPNSSSRPGSP